MKKTNNILALSLLSCLLTAFEEKQEYTFHSDPIDVVIPCHSKDVNQLNQVIKLIKKNIINLNRVIVVSAQDYTNGAEWYAENNFPFNKWDIALEIYHGDPQQAYAFLESHGSRAGWILQQLIKLYAPIVIPNISSNVLVVDADVHFLKPISFTHPDTHAGILTAAYEHHKPYFEHAERLLPGFRKMSSFSGVAHHMLFQRSIILNLLATIEKQHNTEAWRAMCRCIDLKYVYYSSLSEYELYFNFALAHSDKITVRALKWQNIYSIRTPLTKEHYTRISNEYDYIAYHTFN